MTVEPTHTFRGVSDPRVTQWLHVMLHVHGCKSRDELHRAYLCPIHLATPQTFLILWSFCGKIKRVYRSVVLNNMITGSWYPPLVLAQYTLIDVISWTHHLIYCRMPARWGLRRTILALGSDKTPSNKPLKIEKDGPTTGPVWLKQGGPGMSQYIFCHHWNILAARATLSYLTLKAIYDILSIFLKINFFLIFFQNIFNYKEWCD